MRRCRWPARSAGIRILPGEVVAPHQRIECRVAGTNGIIIFSKLRDHLFRLDDFIN